MIYTNYSRQFIDQYSPDGKTPYKNIKIDSAKNTYEALLHNIKNSEKFMLPDGGIIHADSNLRALSNDLLRLPYPCIALEYFTTDEGLVPEGNSHVPRTILVVCENKPDHNWPCDYITIWEIVYVTKHKLWGLYSVTTLPVSGWRKEENNVLLIHHRSLRIGDLVTGEVKHNPEAMQAMYPVLNFLNVLQCQNIKMEKLPPRKTLSGQNKRCKLPFDSYHVLTVPAVRSQNSGPHTCGNHSSPREHLRRGHIRRYQDGKQIWVNATVVNPGVGGKISKSYRFEK